MHTDTFHMPTVRQVWQLIQQGDYAFFIYCKDAYLHVPIFKHHHNFYPLFGNTNLINGGPCNWALLQPQGFSLDLLNQYCSFATAEVFLLLYICMIS